MILKRGNLFDTKCRLIAHGVNCMGSFGSGVAGQIARLYPFVMEEYLRKFKEEGWKLGDVQFVDLLDGIDHEAYCWREFTTIANCATQHSYGREGKYVSYEALGVCLDKIFAYAADRNLEIAMGKIGCELGGGDWSVVSSMIEEREFKFVINVEVWEL